MTQQEHQNLMSRAVEVKMKTKKKQEVECPLEVKQQDQDQQVESLRPYNENRQHIQLYRTDMHIERCRFDQQKYGHMRPDDDLTCPQDLEKSAT